MDPYVPLVLLLAVAAFTTTAWLPGRWSALAWPAPAGVAVLFLVAWLHERQPPRSGDDQPALVALVGAAAVLLTVAAAGLGRRLRR